MIQLVNLIYPTKRLCRDISCEFTVYSEETDHYIGNVFLNHIGR